MALLKGRHSCIVKAGKLENGRTCSVKLKCGEVGRNELIKSIGNHMKELGPYVKGSREHILNLAVDRYGGEVDS